MTRKRLFSGTLFLLLVVLLFTAQANAAPEPAEAPAIAPLGAVAAQSGDVVTAEGEVVPLFDVNLAFQTGGTVAEILVAEGDIVAVGDPLLRLEDDDALLALQQAEARLASAQAARNLAQNQVALVQAAVETAGAQVLSAEANLALTKAGPRAEEIAAAESALAAAEASINQAAGQRDTALNVGTTSQIQAAEAQLAAAVANTRSIQEQYDAIIDACFELPDGSEVCPLYGPVEENTRAQLEAAQQSQAAAQAAVDALRAGPTSAQRQAAQGGVTLASSNRDIAQAQLDLLLAGATAEQIAIAEVAVLQAQVGVDIARAAAAQAEAAVIQADAAVTQAEAGVASAETMVERMTLRSTIDGAVSRIDGQIGETVASGQPVITLADFSSWLVKTTDLTELDVAFVDNGDAATVTFDAIPGESVSGTVSHVSLVAGPFLSDVVYEVTIDLDPAPGLPLRWGMTAKVDIES